jgi:hypothetical protein
MAGPKNVGKGVVLWETRDVSCTCRGVARGYVEIRLTAGAVTLEREVFADAEAAALFAGNKMCDLYPQLGLSTWAHLA